MADNMENTQINSDEKVKQTRNKKNSGIYKHPNNKAASKYIKNRYYTDEEFRNKLLEGRKVAYRKKKEEERIRNGEEPPKEEYITVKKISTYELLKQKEEEQKRKEEELMIKEKVLTAQLTKQFNKSTQNRFNELIDLTVDRIKDDIPNTLERKKLIKMFRNLKKSDDSDDDE